VWLVLGRAAPVCGKELLHLVKGLGVDQWFVDLLVGPDPLPGRVPAAVDAGRKAAEYTSIAPTAHTA